MTEKTPNEVWKYIKMKQADTGTIDMYPIKKEKRTHIKFLDHVGAMVFEVKLHSDNLLDFIDDAGELYGLVDLRDSRVFYFVNYFANRP